MIPGATESLSERDRGAVRFTCPAWQMRANSGVSRLQRVAYCNEDTDMIINIHIPDPT